ncbi:hypothetical protein CS022_04515 [Veronia nyctiphanis]|uniref:Peptidase S1 domain-containing protein n=1 Tax=Veronia nyctiphanis TaxID=1278244 RepID=A0A4Q0YYM4_9GAMM|nr:serine protease [Veronia nyctiphanis]RXJ74319.1 hypothetical protein CS022_04515 [Veronia nyctiphanis]
MLKNITNLLSFLCLLLLIPSAAQASERNPRIIGGGEAPKGAYPYMSYLSESDGKPFCGATYLGGNKVLTAAHCVHHLSVSDFSVTVNALDVSSDQHAGEVFSAKHIVLHPDYNISTSENDIAVVILSDSPKNIEPIKLSSDNLKHIASEKTLLRVIGWGITDTNIGERSDSLQQVDVNFVSDTLCRQRFSAEGIVIPKNAICAGDTTNGGRDACQGDSGGPLLVKEGGKWVQTGIVSYGIGCALADFPGVYTNVPDYIDWLNNIYAPAQPDVNVELSHDMQQKGSSSRPVGWYQHEVNITNIGNSAFDISHININGQPAGQNLCQETVYPDYQCSISMSLKTVKGHNYFDIEVQTNTNESQTTTIYTYGEPQTPFSKSDLIALNLPEQVVAFGQTPWVASGTELKAKAAKGESTVIFDNFPEGELTFDIDSSDPDGFINVFVNQKTAIRLYHGKDGWVTLNSPIKLEGESNYVEFHYRGTDYDPNTAKTGIIRNIEFTAGSLGVFSFVLLMLFGYSRKLKK